MSVEDFRVDVEVKVDDSELDILDKRLKELKNKDISLNADFDSKTLINEIKKTKKSIDEKIKLNVSADDEELTGLKKHLNELRKFVDEVVNVDVVVDDEALHTLSHNLNELDRNYGLTTVGINVQVNDSKADDLQVKLDNLKNDFGNREIPINFGIDETSLDNVSDNIREWAGHQVFDVGIDSSDSTVDNFVYGVQSRLDLQKPFDIKIDVANEDIDNIKKKINTAITDGFAELDINNNLKKINNVDNESIDDIGTKATLDIEINELDLEHITNAIRDYVEYEIIYVPLNVDDTTLSNLKNKIKTIIEDDDVYIPINVGDGSLNYVVFKVKEIFDGNPIDIKLDVPFEELNNLKTKIKNHLESEPVNISVDIDGAGKLNDVDTKLKNLEDKEVTIKLSGTIAKSRIKINKSVDDNPIEINLAGKILRRDINTSAFKENPVKIPLEGSLSRDRVKKNSLDEKPVEVELKGTISRSTLDTTELNDTGNSVKVNVVGEITDIDISKAKVKDETIHTSVGHVIAEPDDMTVALPSDKSTEVNGVIKGKVNNVIVEAENIDVVSRDDSSTEIKNTIKGRASKAIVEVDDIVLVQTDSKPATIEGVLKARASKAIVEADDISVVLPGDKTSNVNVQGVVHGEADVEITAKNINAKIPDGAKATIVQGAVEVEARADITTNEINVKVPDGTPTTIIQGTIEAKAPVEVTASGIDINTPDGTPTVITQGNISADAPVNVVATNVDIDVPKGTPATINQGAISVSGQVDIVATGININLSNGANTNINQNINPGNVVVDITDADIQYQGLNTFSSDLELALKQHKVDYSYDVPVAANIKTEFKEHQVDINKLYAEADSIQQDIQDKFEKVLSIKRKNKSDKDSVGIGIEVIGIDADTGKLAKQTALVKQYEKTVETFNQGKKEKKLILTTEATNGVASFATEIEKVEKIIKDFSIGGVDKEFNKLRIAYDNIIQKTPDLENAFDNAKNAKHALFDSIVDGRIDDVESLYDQWKTYAQMLRNIEGIETDNQKQVIARQKLADAEQKKFDSDISNSIERYKELSREFNGLQKKINNHTYSGIDDEVIQKEKELLEIIRQRRKEAGHSFEGKLSDEQKKDLKEFRESLKYDLDISDTTARTTAEQKALEAEQKRLEVERKKADAETSKRFKDLERLKKESSDLGIKIIKDIDSGVNDNIIDKKIERYESLIDKQKKIEHNLEGKLSDDQESSIKSLDDKNTYKSDVLELELESATEVAKVNDFYKESVRLLKAIGKEKETIAGLDAFGKDALEAGDAVKTLNDLNQEYEELQKKAKEAGITLSESYQESLDKIKAELDRKVESAYAKTYDKQLNAQIEAERKLQEKRAKSVQTIKSDFDADKYAAQADKISNSFRKLIDPSKQLANASDETRHSIEKLIPSYNEAEAAVEEYRMAHQRLEAVLKSADATDDDIIAANKKVEESYKKAERQVQMYENAQKNVDAERKLKVDAKMFSKDIDIWLKENSAASDKFGKQLRNIQQQLKNCDAVTFDRLKNEFKEIKQEAKLDGKTGLTFMDSLKAKSSQYLAYATTAFGLQEVIESLRYMYEAVLEVDTAMTGLRRVTDLTGAQYDVLYDNMIASAKEYGATLTDIINATSDWVRAGFDSETALGLAEVTTVYQHISDLDYDTAAENLLTAYNGFKDQLLALTDGDIVAAVSYVSDIFNELDNNFSVTSAGLGEALVRSASALELAGNTIQETAAMVTGIVEVTQDPKSIGA